MNSNLINYLILVSFFIILNLNSSTQQQQTVYGYKEIFDGCRFQGKESVDNDNINCTRIPVPNLWDKTSNEKCIKEYVKGCQLAKIERFCHQGANDLLRNESIKCENLQQPYEFGIDFYPLCCNVCVQGKAAYLNRGACKRDLPSNASLVELVVQAEFENCCSSKATKGLRSLNDYEDEASILEDLDFCATYGCEQFCVEVDFNQAVCSCRKGFTLNQDGKRCDDIDECLNAPNACSPNQQCVNLNGTYDCKDLELDQLSSAQNQSNETRILNLRSSLNDTQEDRDCKNGYFDPHRNMCVEIVDRYDNFCLDEKCNTNTKEMLESTKKCKDGHKLNSNGYCEDIDECAANNTCPSNQRCVNHIGYFDCKNLNETITCESGLVLKENNCVDVDECKEEKCDADKQCVNLLGSYECEAADNTKLEARNSDEIDQTMCDEGQRKNKDGVCEEIDACKENPGVCGENSNCSNSFGKAICKCKQGYEKNEASGKCEDKDECETGENDCLADVSTCKNLNGSFECICKSGYHKKMDNETCTDIDECEDNELNDCEHTCLNKVGSYECECREGFELAEDKKKCKELNLCEKGDIFCDGICEKKNGTYTCARCKDGVRWSHLDKDNKKCIFKDECKTDPCHPDETCINLKNGKSECVNLKCPSNYQDSKEDKACIKNIEDIKTSDPLSLNKNVMILPVNLTKENERKQVYRFKRMENDDDDDLKFEIDVDNESSSENSIDSTYFELVKENLSHDLYLVKPITKNMKLIVKMNVIFKNRKLHTSELFVFIV